MCIIPNILYNIIDVVICIDERKRVFEVRNKRVAKLNKKFQSQKTHRDYQNVSDK